MSHLLLAKPGPKPCLGIWDGGLEREGSADPLVPVPGAPPCLSALFRARAPWLARQSRDGYFAALLRCCCSINPRRAPQTLLEKARPFLRNGFLYLYNVIGAMEKRGRWIYGNYIKFIESWQARRRKSLWDGGGYLEMEKALKGHQACVSRHQTKYLEGMRWGEGGSPSGTSVGGALQAGPFGLQGVPVREAGLPPSCRGEAETAVFGKF